VSFTQPTTGIEQEAGKPGSSNRFSSFPPSRLPVPFLVRSALALATCFALAPLAACSRISEDAPLRSQAPEARRAALTASSTPAPAEARRARTRSIDDVAAVSTPDGARTHVGKPRAQAPRDLSQRPQAFDRSALDARVVSLARMPKAAAPRLSVARGLVQLARLSSRPLQVRLDPQLGSLRELTGRVPNPYAGRATPNASAERLLLEAALPSFGLTAAAGQLALVERSRMRDPDGGLSLAFDVVYDGRPVWLCELRAQFDAGGALTAVHASRLSELQPLHDLRYGAQAAARRSAAALNARATQGLVFDEQSPALGVWVGHEAERRGGVAAWQVTQRVVEAGIPQIYASYVDAGDGSVLAQHRRVHSQSVEPATGAARDHGGAAIDLAITRFAEDGVFVLLDQSRAGPLWTQHAGNASIFSAPLAIFSFPLVGSATTDEWPTDHAVSHHGVGQVLDYFRQTHERNSWDGQGGELRVAVHLGQSMDNAFFADGPRPFLAINDDGREFLSFSRCLDVLAHEVTHGVINTSANLVYQNQSGALNESIADVMAAMVDTADWTVGEHCLRPPRVVVRSLEDPTLGEQPAHMDDFQQLSVFEDGGGVHINSGIPNRAAFLAAGATSRQLVERVWYRTLTRHLTRESVFDDMARGSLVACDELVALDRATPPECTALAGAWAGVGVLALDQGNPSQCPPKSSARGGLCACDEGFTPAADGTACIAYANVDCPDNSVQVGGECYCGDGFFGLGSECVARGEACPPNSSRNPFGECACDEGFQGSPFGQGSFGKERGCTVMPSDCPDHSHPEWDDPEGAPMVYACLCNEGYASDAATSQCIVPPGSCGDETFFGRCQGKGLVYCGEDGVTEVDCDGSGLICGLVDSRIGFDCLNPAGLGPAAGCDPSMYQQCGSDNPFCIADSDDTGTGFCSLECASQLDCGDRYGCCATVSDGTRACLPASYCAELLDVNVTCSDVEGGSNYFGTCQGNTLRYCDPSTKTTLEIPCVRAGKVCGFADEQTGHHCVPPGSAAVAPADYCPLANNGHCDAPEQCPEGTDLLDCNPCNDVSAQGRCDGDVLQLCDPSAGLVSTDCAALPETASCIEGSGDEPASCVPGAGSIRDGGTSDAGTGAAGGGGSKKDAGSAQDPPEEEDESASCSCRVGPGATRAHAGHGLGLLLALFTSLRLRRRARARTGRLVSALRVDAERAQRA